MVSEYTRSGPVLLIGEENKFIRDEILFNGKTKDRDALFDLHDLFLGNIPAGRIAEPFFKGDGKGGKAFIAHGQ